MHNLTEKRDKAGHLINTWGFDAQDRAVSNSSVQGKGVNIEYVNETQVDVTDDYGTLRTYTIGGINGRKRVIAMQGPGGSPYLDSNVIRWEYDSQMNLTEAETIGGTIYQYQNYDNKGNPETVIFASNTPQERVVTYTYHPNFNLPLIRSEASILGSGNKETIFDYDDDGDAIPNESPTHLLYRIIEKGFTKDVYGTIIPYEYITAFTYNGRGQVLSIDGPLPGNGDTTSFAYNATTGDLLSTTRPIIGSTNFLNYDAAGQAGQITDVNGQSESFTYDGRGRITTITHQADGSTSSVSYNTAGLPDATTDEDGVSSSFEYDPVYSRISKLHDNEGNYITYNYDAQGNMIERNYYDPTDNRTNWKRSVYQDPAHSMPGKIFKAINPDDTFTQYEYDSEGNIASMTDPNTNTTYYDYDPLNRLTTVSQPGSTITSYDYDLHGNLTSVMDAESHVTTYEYDDMGRVISTTSPDTGTVAYAYDEASNLTHKTDAKGISVEYAYDLLDRLTHVGFPDSTQDIGYTYDTGTYGMGRRTGMTDPSGSTTFGYDSRGRLVQKISTLDGFSYSTNRTFTLGGRVISITCPSGRTVDYTRNSIGKTSGVSTTGNGTTTTLINNLLYLPFGPSSGMSMGAGSGVTNVFDELYRTIVTNPGAQTERTYTYDANSNLTSINVTNDVSKYKTFTYDALNRLLNAEGPFGYIDYTYDHVGNRFTKVENNQIITYTYASGTNRLQEITGPLAFTYDANGNIIGIGDKVLTYNQNNRLVRVEEDSTILGEYTYNGLGQRVSKTADGVTTIFLYDFDGNLIAESQADGTIISEYLYMGMSRIAEVNVGSGEIYYFHNDHLGTPELMTDVSGDEVWGAIIKPFGEATVKSTSTVNNNFRLPGQIYDEESGLHYNYFRDYYPGIGRYIESDPIGLDGGINLYVYSLNNPVNFYDHRGLAPWWVRPTGKFLTGAGGIAMTYGLLTGQPEIWGPGAVVAGVGGLLLAYDWATAPIEAKNKAKEWVKPLEDEMKKNEEIISRNGEAVTPTIPEEYTPLPESPLQFQYNPSNPVEIGQNSSISLNVIGGCSPYIWSVSGTGFTLKETGETGPNNKLYADETACGPAEILVTDCDGNPVNGVVRCKKGYWKNIYTCPESTGIPCEVILGKYRYHTHQYFVCDPLDGCPSHFPSCEDILEWGGCSAEVPELAFIDWCTPGGPYGEGATFSFECTYEPTRCAGIYGGCYSECDGEVTAHSCATIMHLAAKDEWTCPE